MEFAVFLWQQIYNQTWGTEQLVVCPVAIRQYLPRFVDSRQEESLTKASGIVAVELHHATNRD